MNKAKVIIPLSNDDFDPSEVAVPWKILTDNGYQVEFATPNGQKASADLMMLSGEGLDPWGWVPWLKKIRLVGLTLRADGNARSAYKVLEQDPNFNNPCAFADLKVENYDGLILPGGHAPKMVPYLECPVLQKFVASFFEQTNDANEHKPIAAVCHGVLVAARSISPTTNRSVLYGKKTTALTWQFEKTAWLLTKYFARFWDPDYYRTYRENADEPVGYWSVESEIKRGLKSEDDFINVPKGHDNFWLKTSGMARDNMANDKPAWVIQDGNYLSARWPGDVHTLTKKFLVLLDKHN